jgi:dihydrofolate synthase / folylpolyglutamate synthase
MNYNQTLDYLFSQLPAYHRIGKAAYKNNLETTLALDKYFNHPHRSFSTIHVAGTNGKGSVSHMLASVLQEAGLKTGLYTSPHLRDFRERIRVNGKEIPKREVTDFVTRHSKIIETLKPSFFEMTVAMAFDYFRNEIIDIAVIEVGLGGRLDSTNIIEPVISVITNIGHDHMDLLGDTIPKVAMEKAGIIKTGIPVVVGETQAETADIFIGRAKETRSKIIFADKEFFCTLKEPDTKLINRRFLVENLTCSSRFSGIIPLGGDYQEKNIQTVFSVLNTLKNTFNLKDKNITDGIKKVVKNTGLKGRWQILNRQPLTICDTGHNKEGLEYVMKQLKLIRANRTHIVIGFVSDKDIESVFPLFPKKANYYFTKASVPRAMDERTLRSRAEAYGLNGASYPTVDEAYKSAQNAAGPDDIIFIGGSTFVVAEVI